MPEPNIDQHYNWVDWSTKKLLPNQSRVHVQMIYKTNNNCIPLLEYLHVVFGVLG